MVAAPPASVSRHHLPPFTSALAVCQHQCAFETLPHVVDCVSAFLDCATPERWSIQRASERDDLRLLRRLAARESPDIDAHYQASLAAEALVAAVRNDNLDIIRWLCLEYCPSMLPVKGIEEAARLKKLHLLDWFFDNHGSARWNKRIAYDAVQSGSLEILKLVLPNIETPELVAEFMSRAWDFELVKYLHERVLELGIDPSSSPLLSDVLPNIVYCGDLEIARFLYSHDYRLDAGRQPLNVSVYDCDLDMVKWLHTLPQTQGSTGWLDAAAGAGKLDIVEWVHENIKDDVCTTRAMDEAADQGYIHILEWLHENRTEGCTTRAMDDAERINVVQWLHEYRSEGCTTRAMDRAALNDDLPLVQWFHEHRTEGCTTEAMDQAAARGRMEMVQWLHENRTEGCTPAAMDMAASGGHLDVVQWLHEHRSEGCTTNAMDNAAECGQLHVLQWLHENRSEGCTTYAMDNAFSLEVVQWLHANRAEGCSERAMEFAACRTGFETVLFLHENYDVGCTENTALYALTSGHLEIFQWVCANYPDRVDLDAILAECTGAEYEYLPAAIAQLRARSP